ncbi:iron-sulfur cluster co-chaperone protein HscB [Tiliqua scincoides]|uniref:iron-sulfur cluster co-chaperone protein HscB n=1 Tax=Tiliqua scincoides TaxID=71010 RepID=UPI003461D731
MWRPAALRRAVRPGLARGRARASAAACWSCGRPCAASPAPRFCPACRALQPPEPGTDLFRLMGCEPTFRLDVAQLQQQFRSLQRSLHPDNFSQRPQAEQGFSEQQSSLVNKAYRTLRSPLSRGLYLLELHGVELEKGTDPEADLDFLSEVLEMNEKLAQAGSDGKIEALEADLAAKQEELTEGVSRAFDQGDLQGAKKLLAKMKYFANLEDKLKAKKVSS